MLLSNDAKIKHLQLSVSHYKEALRIRTKLNGPDHHGVLEADLKLSKVLIALQKIEIIA
jgi:hypothetical protein